jgi:hypothetical protein
MRLPSENWLHLKSIYFHYYWEFNIPNQSYLWQGVLFLLFKTPLQEESTRKDKLKRNWIGTTNYCWYLIVLEPSSRILMDEWATRKDFGGKVNKSIAVATRHQGELLFEKQLMRAVFWQKDFTVFPENPTDHLYLCIPLICTFVSPESVYVFRSFKDHRLVNEIVKRLARL